MAEVRAEASSAPEAGNMSACAVDCHYAMYTAHLTIWYTQYVCIRFMWAERYNLLASPNFDISCTPVWVLKNKRTPEHC